MNEDFKYTIETKSIHEISPNGFEVDGNDRAQHQNFIRMAESRGMNSPILVFNTGSELRLLAGSRKYNVCKELNIEKTKCVVVKNDPPPELETLIENLGRRDFPPAVEAKCIQTLVRNYGIQQKCIAEILDKSKQIISDVNKINELPAEILNDAIKEPIVGKAKLIEIQRLSIDDAEKVMRYYKEKQLAMEKQKIGKRHKVILGQIGGITQVLQNARKAILSFENRAEDEKKSVSDADLKTLTLEFKKLTDEMNRLLERYDQSYSI